MSSETDLDKARKKAKESASKLFGDKPKEVENELEKETVLGKPDNLIKPDNEKE